MRRLLTFAFVAVIPPTLTLLSVVGVPSRPAVFRGLLVDDVGMPVGNALIRIGGAIDAVVISEHDGRFSFDGNSSQAVYTVAVRKYGYLQSGLKVAPKEPPRQLQIVLHRAAAIQGIVLINGRIPAIAASVSADCVTTDAVAHREAKADDRGFFRLWDLPVSQCLVSAVVPPELATLSLPRQAAATRIALNPGDNVLGEPLILPVRKSPSAVAHSEGSEQSSIVHGRVVDIDTYKSLPFSTLLVYSPDRAFYESELTDQFGTFEIRIPTGHARFGAKRRAYVTTEAIGANAVDQVIERVERSAVDVGLARGGIIAGHIYGPNGEPLAGAVLRLYEHRYINGHRCLLAVDKDEATIEANDDGEYRFYGLTPGSYAVAAAPGDQYLRPTAPFSFFQSGQASEAEFVFVSREQTVDGIDFTWDGELGGSVNGHIYRADGSAAGGIRVTVVPSVQSPQPLDSGSSTITDAHGSYAIRSLPTGIYYVQAETAERLGLSKAEFSSVRVNVVAGATVTADATLHRGYPIHGRVVDSDDGRPPRSSPVPLTVVALPQDLDLAPRDGVGQPYAQVGRNGEFEIANVFGSVVLRLARSAEYTLVRVGLGHADITDQPVLLGDLSVIVEVTKHPSELIGRVVSAHGKSPVACSVAVYPTTLDVNLPWSRRSVEARCRADGSFRVVGLPSGTYFVVAQDVFEPGVALDHDWLIGHTPEAEVAAVTDAETTFIQVRCGPCS